jgi:hypothetical protein
MELVLASVAIVSALYLLMILPTSICLRAAEERGVDPLVGLFVGVLSSWVGVILFASGSDGRERSASRVTRQPASPPPDATTASEGGSAVERREPVGAGR